MLWLVTTTTTGPGWQVPNGAEPMLDFPDGEFRAALDEVPIELSGMDRMMLEVAPVEGATTHLLTHEEHVEAVMADCDAAVAEMDAWLDEQDERRAGADEEESE